MQDGIRPHTSSAGVTTYAVPFRIGRRQTSETFTNRKSAERFRDLVKLLGAERALAELNSREEQGPTLDQLAALFFEWKTGNIEGRTLRDYRRDYANWIAPKLGGRQAEAIDELDVQQLVDGMKGRLDPKSIADRHALLHAIFKFGAAKSRRHVTQNPCLETQLPPRKKKPPKGFTLPQWEAMHAWGREHEPDADDLLLFIASSGWRFSEATPLTPAAVEDFGDVEISPGLFVPAVFVSVLGVHRRDQDDRIVYAAGEAKSEAGHRRINLPPEGARMIRRRLVGLGVGDLIFTSPTGKQWRSNNFLDREFSRILEGAGIVKVRGMGPHFLRHTHVMMLDRAGVSASKTQRRIGHEHLETTFGTYGGMIDNTLTPEELLRLDALKPAPVAGEIVQGEVVDPPRVLQNPGRA